MDRSASTQNVIRFLRDPHISCRLTFPTCYPCTSHTYAMHTSWDVAVLGHEQQSSAAACGAAVRFAGAEATFPQFDSHVGMCPYGNTFTVWACLRVAEQNHYLGCDVPEAHGQKRERTCICLCRCVCAVSREREREWGEDCSIPHRIDFPAQRGDVGNVSL